MGVCLRIFVLVAVVIAAFVLELAYQAGELRSDDFAHGLEQCKWVEQGVGLGIEDGVIVHEYEIAILCSDLRTVHLFGTLADRKTSSGKCVWMDLKDHSVHDLPLVGHTGVFHPHGVGLLPRAKSSSGYNRLFVVNHRVVEPTEAIESFDLVCSNNDPRQGGCKLEHRDTVTDENIFRGMSM
jgi:hypothetical protein